MARFNVAATAMQIKRGETKNSLARSSCGWLEECNILLEYSLKRRLTNM